MYVRAMLCTYVLCYVRMRYVMYVCAMLCTYALCYVRMCYVMFIIKLKLYVNKTNRCRQPCHTYFYLFKICSLNAFGEGKHPKQYKIKILIPEPMSKSEWTETHLDTAGKIVNKKLVFKNFTCNVWEFLISFMKGSRTRIVYKINELKSIYIDNEIVK